MQLRNAENIQELFSIGGRWHPLAGNYNGYLAGCLTANWRILIRGVGAPEVNIDWKQNRIVRIEEIADYH